MAVMASEALLTRADRDALPEDGRRHELLDGAIVVTPSPGFGHQEVVVRLAAQLLEALKGSHLVVLTGPFDVVLSEATVVVPDLVVARRGDFTARDLPVAPLLVVEVRSRSTATIDALIKRELYERAGVPSYWLVDPAGPAITVLELVDGRYQQVAQASAQETIDVAAPAPMRLTPARWLTSD